MKKGTHAILIGIAQYEIIYVLIITPMILLVVGLKNQLVKIMADIGSDHIKIISISSCVYAEVGNVLPPSQTLSPIAVITLARNEKNINIFMVMAQLVLKPIAITARVIVTNSKLPTLAKKH
ncbi:MAG: hypothetical protein WC422_01110 [Candidatus Paceibacterota bacterium]|jgi:hypothetical protein